jgi:hypothetical protein
LDLQQSSQTPVPNPITYKSIIERYIELGFKLVFWPSDLGKKPIEDKWPEKARNGEYTLDKYHEGMNVGVLLGVEISPGRFLADVDFDWQCQPMLAHHILPGTLFEFGRRSKKSSHLFYTTSEPLKSKIFRDPFQKERLDPKNSNEFSPTITGADLSKSPIKLPTNICEFRCAAKNTLGNQTVLPPSKHLESGGELIELDRPTFLWEPYGRIAHDSNNILPHRVSLYAAAYLLYEQFQNGRFHHEERLAAAGFFLACGLSDPDIYLLNEALALACDNNVQDAKDVVKSTLEVRGQKGKGKRITGRRSLAIAIGKHGNRVLLEVAKILGGPLFSTDKKGVINPQSQENIRIALDLMGIALSYNEFTQQPMFSQDDQPLQPIQDQHVDHFWLEIDNIYHFRPSKDLFQTVLKDAAWQNKFHPVREYFNSLVWDGNSRLDTWLIDCAKADDNDYVRTISAMWMIAAVRRIKYPGTKFDELVILESEQGKLKSSAIKLLCPNEDWYSDNYPLNASPREMIELTRGNFIIECADLVGMKAAQVEQLKASLSRTVDSARMSYGIMTTNVHRQHTPIATTNSHVYLKDSTGNRRFWPIRVQQFDLGLLGANRDQLWAEAVARESKGESIRLPQSLYAIAEFQQERRREEDPWEEVLRDYFRVTGRYRITFNELWDVVHIQIERRTVVDQGRLSAIMVRAGFKKGMVRAVKDMANGKIVSYQPKPSKGWTCREHSLEERKIKQWLGLEVKPLSEFVLTDSSQPDSDEDPEE